MRLKADALRREYARFLTPFAPTVSRRKWCGFEQVDLPMQRLRRA